MKERKGNSIALGSFRRVAAAYSRVCPLSPVRQLRHAQTEDLEDHQYRRSHIEIIHATVTPGHYREIRNHGFGRGLVLALPQASPQVVPAGIV